MSTGLRDGMASIAQQGLVQPKETMCESKQRNNSLYIGIPKEVSFQENRIALTPLSVALLVNNGHKVIIETGAGVGANFSDQDYSEQGALICFDKKVAEQLSAIFHRKLEVVNKTAQHYIIALQCK